MTAAPQGSAIPMNDLARGIRRDREALNAAIAEVLDSGYVIMGPHHAAFQAELAAYLGVSHAIGVASGTDALELAIKAVMPVGRNAVLTAANAGGYTTTAAKHTGFDVLFADVDEQSLCLTAATVDAALTDDVGVVVVTHLFGNLTDIDGLITLCHARNIRVVEDCAQAIGARRDGGFAGSFGDVAAISFYPTKNLGALGDGGAVVTNDADIAATVRQLRQYGWGVKYHVDMAGGTNSRLDEIQAAMLRVRLPMLDGFNARRRYIVGQYCAAAVGTSITVLPASTESHVAHLAVARSSNREKTRVALLRLGVQTDVHFPVPDHYQHGFGATKTSLPTTEKTANEIFSIPCFPELTDDEVLVVCKAIESL